MWNFKQGQKVVCVDDKPRNTLTSTGLKYGRVYTVWGMTRCQGGSGVALVEVAIPEGYTGFFPDRFRPAVNRKENLEVFYQMLTPTKVTEGV